METSVLIAQESIDMQSQAILSLKSLVKTQESRYTKILEVLRKPGLSNYESRIIITGIGKNANIAAKASETFASLGIPSMYLNTAHYSHGDAGFIGHNDVVIHISRSGKTEEMLHASKHLRHIRPDVKQFLLHCNSKLSVAISSIFDECFWAGDVIETDDNNLAPTTSTVVLLALIDTFAINLSRERNFTRANFLEYHPGGSLGQMLKKEL
ncbi:arabinose 5-phosphate isomerase [Pseudomonas phage PspYZU05]|uniref:SIS domain-containing protein n=1 Tax=Pseudomonas phage PspYZU05 TaxID=1983556 RepID=A0A2U7NLT3_9CAUD|nr:arabinose 5-phosphate isomerase [Pseudomonas phage PspYZU05]ASD52028.1 hypothetical protein PspYZU05_76 [Pseudomonas phage PspYZU05]